MYKVKISKDIEFRGFEYKKDETYNVSRKIKEFFRKNDVISKPTKKKSKKEDLDIS
jgi:hypothetical protein